ncbi:MULTISPECIES: endonuclease/exonuclease/phosphatase family protein [Trueperella]|uniref:Endonuclease/exonuclease/phosphatase family metal-dependent hydrolase n=1 Tax=Trueperella abortisuis TaxID=445930 RepID=A0ABT9PKL6_9ACTO|nr:MULTISPECIES: endonuclease/exonuclease/phosphatase family protein [Trueperella]MDP9833262.1 endonuclease/exonuclease/phosphatase family metal-dependent hydrolase [Trueperella abortisuis]MDY5403253.1 endonuclease/exonuclease/phosphatase family protein [Trueperella sp.]
MEVLTFNIQYATPVPAGQPTASPGAGKRAGLGSARFVAAQIARLDADVAGLQEVDRGKWRSGRVDQLRLIAQASGANALFAPTRRRYGMGLVSRWPVLRARILRLPGRATSLIRDGRPARWRELIDVLPAARASRRGRESTWRIKWPDQRACLYALLDTPDGPIAVGVTHLSTVRQTAREQLAVALGGFDHFAPGVPALLIGDLNLRINHVEEELIGHAAATPGPPTFEILHRGNGTPSWDPRIQIDHVLGRGLCVLQDRTVPMPVSDHAAVVVGVTGCTRTDTQPDIRP